MPRVLFVLLLCLVPWLSACGDDGGPALPDAGEREGDDPGECSDQADNDLDGAFDCDDTDCAGSPACCPDQDGDGVCDEDDACPDGDDNLDTDSDGTADFCDPCPVDPYDDSDGDGFCDSEDGCASLDLYDNDGWLESPANPFDDADLVQGTAAVWFRGIGGDVSVFSGEGWIQLAVNVTGIPEGCSDGQCNAAVGTTVVNDARWHHLAVTWDASSTSLYVDGALEDTIASANLPLVENHDRSFVLGKHASPQITATLDGQIAEAALWNVLLDPAEILAHRDGEPVQQPQLLWWRLQEGNGTQSLDASGNGHVGTLVSGATWSGTCPRADADGDGQESWTDPDDTDPSQ